MEGQVISIIKPLNIEDQRVETSYVALTCPRKRHMSSVTISASATVCSYPLQAGQRQRLASNDQRVSNEPASQDHRWKEAAVTWKVWPTLWICTGICFDFYLNAYLQGARHWPAAIKAHTGSPRSGTSLCWELSSCAMPPWPLMDEALDESRSFSSFEPSHSGKNRGHVAGLSV
ncbi:hypothetical protein CH63R_11742 [Colletotrichum higginsianum IMI 349063]|uniref:Uncharacterized protein n=1 Tax=Colletotrichum higginsianum (strain IMI 349063) TaxID=759273 RepID=A0A1B7XZ70_COLHI|nr:hypothetical protein CH63R_11742 [Colletotrichum higginsianum IMI 349063]OBR05039.1 hypothetical protein CH63R_11742 [Colletotrichum higginsianum IMI 349063]